MSNDLEEVTWNLDDLLEGVEAPDPEAAVSALLDEADAASDKFAAEYEGKVAELDGPGLIVAMTKLADISDRAGRALNYAHLRFAADTADPENGALLQSGSERATVDRRLASLLPAYDDLKIDFPGLLRLPAGYRRFSA